MTYGTLHVPIEVNTQQGERHLKSEDVARVGSRLVDCAREFLGGADLSGIRLITLRSREAYKSRWQASGEECQPGDPFGSEVRCAEAVRTNEIVNVMLGRGK
jgi:hypothetical protein